MAELQQENFNPILMYKAQGELDLSFPSLSSDSFVLALQTEFQLELYTKFASSVLCVDSTHGTNAYNFKLITCIVADEFGQGTIISVIIITHIIMLSILIYRSACGMVHFRQGKYRGDATLPFIPERQIS